MVIKMRKVTQTFPSEMQKSRASPAFALHNLSRSSKLSMTFDDLRCIGCLPNVIPSSGHKIRGQRELFPFSQFRFDEAVLLSDTGHGVTA